MKIFSYQQYLVYFLPPLSNKHTHIHTDRESEKDRQTDRQKQAQ